jgi:hypothetical protein
LQYYSYPINSSHHRTSTVDLNPFRNFMKRSIFHISKQVSWIAFFAATIWACHNDDSGQGPITAKMAISETNPTAEENIMMISTAMNIKDVSTGGLQAQGVADGRISMTSAKASTLDCGPALKVAFTVDYSHKDSVIYTGSLIADYGTGLTCSPIIKKGKFTDAFLLAIPSNNVEGYSLTEFVSFQNFQSDTLILNGRYVSKSTNVVVAVLLQDFTVSYSSGGTSLISGSLNFVRQKMDDGFTLYPDGSKQVTGGINGYNRKGTPFDTQITKALLFNYSCSTVTPVSGTIDMAIGNVETSADFGSGVCDKNYTITINGTTTASTL